MNALVNKLLAARARVAVADIGPADIPGDEILAYAVGLVQTTGVAAWKIGGANPWSRRVFDNRDAFFGPLGPSEVFEDTVDIALSGLLAPLAEPEIMLRIGDGVDFSHMGIGIEIPASVLPDAVKPMLLGQICDRAGAGALWISAIQPVDEARLTAPFEIAFQKNDMQIVTGSAANVIGGPLATAQDLVARAPDLGLPLRAGQWIATGGLCPAVPVVPGDALSLSVWGQKLNLTFRS